METIKAEQCAPNTISLVILVLDLIFCLRANVLDRVYPCLGKFYLGLRWLVR